MLNEEREIKKEKQGIVVETFKTEISKHAFINDIKNGLGNEIKTNLNKVEIIKERKKEKFIKFLKNIFNKF